MQSEVKTAMSAPSQEQLDARASNARINLENAFVVIDGKRHSVVDLLRLVAEKLG